MDSRDLDRGRTEEYLCPGSIKLTARLFIMRGNYSWKNWIEGFEVFCLTERFSIFLTNCIASFLYHYFVFYQN